MEGNADAEGGENVLGVDVKPFFVGVNGAGIGGESVGAVGVPSVDWEARGEEV